MVLGIAPDQVLLADPNTGRELARLTTLQPVTPTPLVFSPDGTKLIARTNQKTALVWDLRRIRDQLAPMGLDWDAPPYPTVPAASDAAGPLPLPRPVRVVGEVIEPQARRRRIGRAKPPAHRQDRRCRGPDPSRLAVHPAEEVARSDRRLGAGLAPPARRHRCPVYAGRSVQPVEQPAGGTGNPGKVPARCPDDIDIRVVKGQVALQLGRLQEAVDDFSKVLDADPELRSSVRYRRAQIWVRLGKFQEALADLDALIQRFPSDPALYYELRSQVHDRLGHREQAKADMKQAAESPQAGADHYNNLAWRLATGPAALRDPEQALVLARKAVALAPGTAIYLNTLGVAQYRAEQYAEAITTLEKSLAAGKGQSDAFDLFFLAMARHKLGQIDRARADLDRALRWRREHPNPAGPGWSEELNMFQAEAEDLLNAALPPLPADPFAPDQPGQAPRSIPVIPRSPASAGLSPENP